MSSTEFFLCLYLLEICSQWWYLKRLDYVFVHQNFTKLGLFQLLTIYNWPFSHDIHWNLWWSRITGGTSLRPHWPKKWMKIKSQSPKLIIKMSNNRFLWGMSTATECQNSYWVILMMNYSTDFSQMHGRKVNWRQRAHGVFRLTSQKLGYLHKSHKKYSLCI